MAIGGMFGLGLIKAVLGVDISSSVGAQVVESKNLRMFIDKILQFIDKVYYNKLHENKYIHVGIYFLFTPSFPL